MDTRQLLGLLLLIAGALWLWFKGRKSAMQPPDAPLDAGAKGLWKGTMLGVILLILGALLLVPWSDLLGTPDPCCPIGHSREIPLL